MNVKNFIEFLKQFPDDTEVEVIKTSSGRNWQGESHTWEPSKVRNIKIMIYSITRNLILCGLEGKNETLLCHFRRQEQFGILAGKANICKQHTFRGKVFKYANSLLGNDRYVP